MKKLLSLIISFVLIFSCFAVTVFAEDMATGSVETPTSLFEEDTDEEIDIFNAKMPTGTFSDRYEHFYVDGEQYTRINKTLIETNYKYNWIIEEVYNDNFYTGDSIYLEYSEQQKQEIKSVKLSTNKDRTLVEATLTYFDGAEMIIVYLKASYLEEYNKIVSGETDKLTIEITYPANNNVVAERPQLNGEVVTFTNSRLVGLEDDYDIIAQNSDGSMSVIVGKLLIIDDEYYYLNYKEAGFNESDWYSGSIGKIANKPLHKITDAQLVKDIDKAMEEYYNDDYGVLYDDNVTESISIAFFVFVFAFIPFIILVFFFIKAIKGKGIYKKMYITIVVICLAELIIFSILAGLFYKTSSLGEFEFTLAGRTVEEYAEDMGIGTKGEEVVLIKEGYYCGDGDCRDGCTTGYFYRDKNFSEEDAMLELELGEKTDRMYDRVDNAVIYAAEWSENIVVNSTEFANGYLVEYEVIGVG